MEILLLLQRPCHNEKVEGDGENYVENDGEENVNGKDGIAFFQKHQLGGKSLEREHASSKIK